MKVKIISIVYFLAILVPVTRSAFYIGRYKHLEIEDGEELNDMSDQGHEEDRSKRSTDNDARSNPHYILYNKEDFQWYQDNFMQPDPLFKKQGEYSSGGQMYMKEPSSMHKGYAPAKAPVGQAYLQPHPHRYKTKGEKMKIFGPFDPPTLFHAGSKYQNDKKKGYSITNKKKIQYVIPPFTPGGRVNVAFQFWVPLSVGGFFVSGRDMEEALQSNNPNHYLAKLFVKHLTSNLTSDSSITDYFSKEVFDGIQTLIEWALPNVPLFQDKNDFLKNFNTINEEDEEKNKQKQREEKEESIGSESKSKSKRSKRDLNSRFETDSENQEGRVLWNSVKDLSQNSIYDSYRPTSSDSDRFNHKTSKLPGINNRLPMFAPSSFDEITSANVEENHRGIRFSKRLYNIDYYFDILNLHDEDCRKRILCEIVNDSVRFSPLSEMFSQELRFDEDDRSIVRELRGYSEGERLLTYLDAAHRGSDRSHQCDIYRYDCRVQARDIVNTDSLAVWREVVRWLTIKVLAQDFPRRPYK